MDGGGRTKFGTRVERVGERTNRGKNWPSSSTACPRRGSRQLLLHCSTFAHPWTRTASIPGGVSFSRGEKGPRNCRCALFTVLLSKAFRYRAIKPGRNPLACSRFCTHPSMPSSYTVRNERNPRCNGWRSAARVTSGHSEAAQVSIHERSVAPAAGYFLVLVNPRKSNPTAKNAKCS